MKIPPNQAEYQHYIRKCEVWTFPSLLRSPVSIKSASNGTYVFWNPNMHFDPKGPLLTEDVIKDLNENDKQLLSVGCGTAHLERLLVRRLGIRKEQITLADRNPEYVPWHVRRRFKFYGFDMYGEWPQFGSPFDYVIFPYSIDLGKEFYERSVEQEKEGLLHIITNALDVLNVPGQLRADNVWATKSELQWVREQLSQRYLGVSLDDSTLFLLLITKDSL